MWLRHLPLPKNEKLETFDLGVQNMGSDGSVPTGCDWHPNVADHQRMAAFSAATIIEARLVGHDWVIRGCTDGHPRPGQTD